MSARRTALLALTITAALPVSYLHAGSHTLEETVVTASRFEEAKALVPANVSIINRPQIAQSSATNVPELLRSESGLFISDITGNGRSYRVDLRGFGATGGSNTLVLVDGRRINAPDLSGTDWSLIPLDRVARIEIIRGGGAAVLYGENASGGVINIITQPGEETKRTLKLSGGSYNSGDVSLTWSGSTERTQYALQMRYATSDGYRDNSDSESRDLGINLTHAVADNALVHLKAGIHRDDTGLPGSLRESQLATMDRTAAANANDYSETADGYLHITPEIDLNEAINLSSDLSMRRRNVHSYATFTGGSFDGETRMDMLGFAPRLKWNGHLAHHLNRLILGGDLEYAKSRIHNNSSFFGNTTLGNYRMRKRSLGLFVQNRLSIRDNLHLDAGYRYSQARYGFDPGTPGTTTMRANSYSVGLRHALDDKTSLFARYDRSFRFPLLDEMFNFFTNTIDSNLKAQHANTMELGLNHRFIPELGMDLTLFNIDTSNEIYFDPNLFSNRNMDGEVRRSGVELTLKRDWQQGGISLGYTYLRARLRHGLYDGNKLPTPPEHKANLRGHWQFDQGLRLTGDLQVVGKRGFEGDYKGEIGEQGGHFVANMGLRYPLWDKRVNLMVDIKNITNNHYADYLAMGTFPTERGYMPAPTRHLTVGLSSTF
uniref:Putative TonB-dependent receptor n=1 Tax=Magnetococcus massalia (strain MO-1) TaxID=451514 RepID=A0A1S7LKW9_MAGMO|nr:putative TonB-dependent receptor [Candidatus Magnetococcus massalia]